MRYAILGGDMRFAHLAQMLKESGRHAAGFLQEQAGGQDLDPAQLRGYSCILSNWPMKWPLSKRETNPEELLSYIAPGSVLLLCGPQFPQRRRWDLQYVNLWQDETLLQENAYLTAQGAAASAMRTVHGSLQGERCMVVGCGRIGRSLNTILLNLGAKLTVVSSSESKRSQARQSGAQAVSMTEMIAALPGQRVIFSTTPAMFLDRAALEHVSPDALIIDLASPPYGVDLDAAGELGLHAVREPGLPGRYAPLSAARALFNAVVRWEGEQHE